MSNFLEHLTNNILLKCVGISNTMDQKEANQQAESCRIQAFEPSFCIFAVFDYFEAMNSVQKQISHVYIILPSL